MGITARRFEKDCGLKYFFKRVATCLKIFIQYNLWEVNVITLNWFKKAEKILEKDATYK